MKGIKQLIGANKCLSNNWQISSKDGKPVEFNRNIVPHCIILVSELIPFGDWTEVQKEILTSMISERIFLHVFDFLEFMKFITASKGRREYLDYHLMKRSERFVESQGNIFIKAKFIEGTEG